MEALHENERISRLTMIGPDVRPAFVSDKAAYRARLDRTMRQSDIVKVSGADLGWLLPGKRDTVGAGNAVSAGFLGNLHEREALEGEGSVSVDREALEAALEYGVAAGGFAVTRAGGTTAVKRGRDLTNDD